MSETTIGYPTEENVRPAAQRARQAAVIISALVPAGVTIERRGRKVFVSMVGPTDPAGRGFMLTFSDEGQTMSTPDTLRHSPVEALDALTAIRKHYA